MKEMGGKLGLGKEGFFLRTAGSEVPMCLERVGGGSRSFLKVGGMKKRGTRRACLQLRPERGEEGRDIPQAGTHGGRPSETRFVPIPTHLTDYGLRSGGADHGNITQSIQRHQHLDGGKTGNSAPWSRNVLLRLEPAAYPRDY